MLKQSIACCFHPTVVVVIDDQRSYLDNLTLGFSERFAVKSFSNPFEALDYLEVAQDKTDTVLNGYVSSLKNRENIGDLDKTYLSHAYTDIDVFGIHKMIYDPNRFNRMVVVIVDYAMPGMDGFRICSALKDWPFKFLMLTGKVMNNEVIKAFNAGLIDRFMSKEQRDFFEQLESNIFDLQYAYFQESTHTIIKNLSASPVSCLGDPAFIEFFNVFFKEKQLFEYYIVNESGCFLFLDLYGKPSWLVIKTEHEMQALEQIASDCDAPLEVISPLRLREKVLFLFSEEDESIPVQDWEQYMYPAKKFKGDKADYYYTYIPDAGPYHLDQDKIASYHNFLMQFKG